MPVTAQNIHLLVTTLRAVINTFQGTKRTLYVFYAAFYWPVTRGLIIKAWRDDGVELRESSRECVRYVLLM